MSRFSGFLLTFINSIKRCIYAAHARQVREDTYYPRVTASHTCTTLARTVLRRWAMPPRMPRHPCGTPPLMTRHACGDAHGYTAAACTCDGARGQTAWA